ncbi:MAG: alanine racemase [Enterocloster bolteae]
MLRIDTGRKAGRKRGRISGLLQENHSIINLYVEGVYSHMATVNWPDVSAEYGLWQYERFSSAIEVLGEEGKKIPFCQLANTPGGIALPEIRMTECVGTGNLRIFTS